MRRLKTTALAVVFILAVTAVTGCTTFNNFKEAFFSEKGVASDTIKIGVLQPQTGNDSKYGVLEIQGIEMAHELVPEVLGKEIELVYADTQSSIYVTESAAADLIAKKPALILGSYGDANSLIAAEQFEHAKIPAITITATNPLITANNEFYFRMSFTDSSQGKVLAGYVYEGLKEKTAAIVRMQNEDVSAATVSSFSQRLKVLTQNPECIKAIVDIAQKEPDYEVYMKEIWESKAKAVFMPIPLAAAEGIFEQANKMGLRDVTFIGPKDWYGDDLIIMQNKFPNVKIAVASDVISKDAAEDIQQSETSALYDKFFEAYQEKHRDNQPPEQVALAFDAYMIAVQAIEKAGSTDGYLIKDALQKTNNYNGVSGKITFDESGEPKKTINVDILQDGKYKTVYTAN